MNFSKTGWTSIVLCHDRPEIYLREVQMDRFIASLNSPSEIIAVGDASWCFTAWTSSGHCFTKNILCLKFEFNTRIQHMRVIFDSIHNCKIPAIHKQPTWMCVCTRSCYNWLWLVRQCNLAYELPCREISDCFVKNWHGIARIVNQIPNSRNLN